MHDDRERDEEEKRKVIPLADAVVEPDAVVIEARDADVAHATVLRPQRSVDLRHALVDQSATSCAPPPCSRTRQVSQSRGNSLSPRANACSNRSRGVAAEDKVDIAAAAAAEEEVEDAADVVASS